MNKITRLNLIFSTISIMLCQTVYMFYVTSRSVVLPTILSDLGGMSFYGVTLILSSMTMAVTTPVSGKLGDMFGRKKIYLIGLLTYTVSLLACAIAPNVFIFMLAIACSGISYGFACPQMYALIVDIYDQSTGPKILAYVSVTSSISSLLGPIIGGLCADFASWRAVFLIMVPMALINFISAFIGIPHIEPIVSNSNIDYLGTALFAGTVMPFLYLLTSAGSSFAWASLQTVILALVSFICFASLMKCEKKAINPILPLHLFKEKIFVICILVTVFSGLSYAAVSYLPIYYQLIKEMSATASGFVTIPRQIATMAASLMIGTFYSRRKDFKLGNVLPMFLALVSLFLMGIFSSITPVLIIVVAEIIFGISNGILLITPNAMGQYFLSKKNIGVGIAFIGFASTFGNSLGSALTAGILSQFWNVTKIVPSQLLNILTPAQIHSLSSTNTLKSPELLQEICSTLPIEFQAQFYQSVENLKLGFTRGITTAFLVYTAISMVLLLILWRFPWQSNSPKTED